MARMSRNVPFHLTLDFYDTHTAVQHYVKELVTPHLHCSMPYRWYLSLLFLVEKELRLTIVKLVNGQDYGP